MPNYMPHRMTKLMSDRWAETTSSKCQKVCRAPRQMDMFYARTYPYIADKLAENMGNCTAHINEYEKKIGTWDAKIYGR